MVWTFVWSMEAGIMLLYYLTNLSVETHSLLAHLTSVLLCLCVQRDMKCIYSKLSNRSLCQIESQPWKCGSYRVPAMKMCDFRLTWELPCVWWILLAGIIVNYKWPSRSTLKSWSAMVHRKYIRSNRLSFQFSSFNSVRGLYLIT